MADAHVTFLEMLRRDQNEVDVLPREWVRAEQNLLMPAPKWKSRLRCFPSVSVARVAVEDKSVVQCQQQDAPEA